MANKLISFETFMLSTDRQLTFQRETAYTNDVNSVQLSFDIKDLDDLTAYTPNVLLYMRDGSFYQITEQTLITKSGTTVSYTLKDNEGKHNGLVKAQLLLVDGTTELASAKHEFRIEAGLDTVVDTEVMIQDWSTITAEAEAYIDDFVAAEADRQQLFEANVSDRQQTFQTNESARETNENERISNEEARQALYNELLETGVLQTNINTKLEELETQYAPRLDELDAQLAQKALQSDLEVEKARIDNLTANAGDTDNNAELLDIRVGYDGVTYTSAGEAVRQTIGAYMTEENESWVV